MPMYDQNFYEQYWEKRNSATYWNAEFLYQRSLILDIIHALPAPRIDKIESILDVGCGNGIITALLADCFPHSRVLGLDFSKKAIDMAQKEFVRNNLIFKHEDIAVNQWPYRKQSVDLITCFEVLEHLDQWESALGLIAETSCRYILISVPIGRMRKHEVKGGHLRNFKRGQIETFLGERNFKPQHLFYAGFPFYSPIWRDLAKLLSEKGRTIQIKRSTRY
jgi:SAM-dependent methyltransferase